MKKVLICLLSLMAAMAVTTSSYAAGVYTLLSADLLALTEVSDVPAGVGALTSATPSAGGVWYTGTIDNHATQFRYLLLGDTTPPVTDLSTYSNYALFFENKDNNDPWSVNVFLETGSGSTYFASSWLALAPGASGAAVLDLSGVSDLDDVQTVGLGIAYNGDNPGPGGTYQGDAFNILVRPVPEPTSMLLLGIGLVGLAGGKARKRFKV
ncbi:PEP-CTERM sorting domain-containing protein [Candidatus Omnitrophota bacterium]